MAEKRNDGDGDGDGGKDRPMNEAEWEAYFKRSDARAARFGELLETMGDDPDRFERAAEEMGWRKAGQFEPAGDWEAEAEEVDDDDEEEDGEFDLQALLDEPQPWDEIPAYQAVDAVAGRARDVVYPMLMARGDGDDGSDESDDLAKAFITLDAAAAKIAGGDGMGYADDVICGNIVCNKIALASLDECREAWGRLVEGKLVDAAVAGDILADLAKARVVLEARIAELRSRVWW